MLIIISFFSFLACCSVVSFQGFQFTGLCACCSRYGLDSFIKSFVKACVSKVSFFEELQPNIKIIAIKASVNRIGWILGKQKYAFENSKAYFDDSLKYLFYIKCNFYVHSELRNITAIHYTTLFA